LTAKARAKAQNSQPWTLAGSDWTPAVIAPRSVDCSFHAKYQMPTSSITEPSMV
jgi:hypothetical protein